MAAEVPTANCYCCGDDITSGERKKEDGYSLVKAMQKSTSSILIYINVEQKGVVLIRRECKIVMSVEAVVVGYHNEVLIFMSSSALNLKLPFPYYLLHLKFLKCLTRVEDTDLPVVQRQCQQSNLLLWL